MDNVAPCIYTVMHIMNKLLWGKKNKTAIGKYGID